MTLKNVVALSPGGSHTCALRADGRIFCWGFNNLGQLGIGSTSSSFLTVAPVDTPALTSAVTVASGADHTCAIKASGQIFCWGDNFKGQLGNNSSGGFSAAPVQVSTSTGLTNAVALAAGINHTCALRADGQIFCWGDNGFGKLGIGSAGGFRDSPFPVTSIPAGNAVALAAGSSHTCALLFDGRVFCAGDNTFGQLGRSPSLLALSNTFVQVGGGELIDAVGLNAGSRYNCALRVTGRVACWGDNTFGQLGNRSSGGFRDSPVEVKRNNGSLLANATAVSAGSAHACALLANGDVFCWGANSFGQLGFDSDSAGASRDRAIEVPSFLFNIDPDVTIKPNGKKARVFALANCEAGAKVRIHLELHQGNSVGDGQATGECTGALERYPVKVIAHGHDRFVAGAAQANADAVVREGGQVIDTQEWTRAVTISAGNLRDDDE